VSRGDWIPTEREEPPEGDIVEAMDSGGHVHLLKRRGRLWWFADGSMYVYFTPKFWRQP